MKDGPADGICLGLEAKHTGFSAAQGKPRKNLKKKLLICGCS